MHDAAKRETDLPPHLVTKDDIISDPSGTKVYVPAAFRHLFLFLVHGSKHSGHVGVGKAAKELSRTLWWPKLRQDVEEYVRGCLLCQCLRRTKPSTPALGSLSTIGLGRVVSVDYIGPAAGTESNIGFS